VNSRTAATSTSFSLMVSTVVGILRAIASTSVLP